METESSITIKLDNAGWMDVDVIRMMVRENIENIIKTYNSQNSTEVKLNEVAYDHPAFHKMKEFSKPLLQQLEEKAAELYPEEIVKKKDKSKALRKAYVEGGLTAQKILNDNS